MGKEESPHSIVRISISFGVFVVDTVITRPVVNAALVGNGVAKHKKEANREGGRVGAMRPKTVHSDCYTKATILSQS